MISDLKFVKDNGFNMMKFCLWIPPSEFLELADAMGVIVWMEYPTWHPQLTPERLPDLTREFSEFFNFDRNHPSVLFRSLTCETGPGADLEVIKRLYHLAHKQIPNALIEDDSSWIEWNRVTDFYDDHPYGNNDSWVKTLRGLNDYIAKHEPKPLLLGEAIAADTWYHEKEFDRGAENQSRYWVPGSDPERRDWIKQMTPVFGPGAIRALATDSLRYAWLMRKYQAESFRREIPLGGYVVSVIRDFPAASMGLINYANRPKWSQADWAWQGDDMLLLGAPSDQRSFWSGEDLQAQVYLSRFGDTKHSGSVELSLQSGRRILWKHTIETGPTARAGNAMIYSNQIALPRVEYPQLFRVNAGYKSEGRALAENHWDIWLLPQPATNISTLFAHPSFQKADLDNLKMPAAPWDQRSNEGIALAAKWDDSLADFLERGGKVLMCPDGSKNSFPLRSQWFLRGGPAIPRDVARMGIPPGLLVDLQHFDLSGKVIPDAKFLSDATPIAALWDTHDHLGITTHALAFEAKVGKGLLLVSTFDHASSPAGQWLFHEFLRELEKPSREISTLNPLVWARLRQEINAQEINLAKSSWHFKPDPENIGLKENWPANPAGAAEWPAIHIGRAWESQGYPALDHWAWYFTQAKIPAEWAQKAVFITFTGVDDMYELYINGRLAGKRGDEKSRETSFSESFSHDITRWAKEGDTLNIFVRVYDWHGAGGIFQPVYLSPVPYSSEGNLLSRGN
jgi:hypothetical protein